MKNESESIIKSDPNESQDSKANRLETPEDVYYSIVDTLSQLGIDPPELDVFASAKNSRCIDHISKEQDAMITEFVLPNGKVPKSIFANAPHADYKSFLMRIYEQYQKHNFNAIILIPTTNMRTSYWQDIVEPNRIEVNPKGFAFYYPLRGAIYFELDKEQLKDKYGKKQHAHNAYNVLLLINKNKVKDFKDKLYLNGICQ